MLGLLSTMLSSRSATIFSPDTKPAQGVDPNLLAQFPLAEEAVAALGVVVWPMVEFEADDALATAATRFNKNKSVEQIVICSPDKDLAQLVSGNQHRLLGSPAGHRHRRGRRGGEVRRAPAIHPGLAGAGRRFRGWLSRHPRLGSQVRGGGACAL